MPEGLPQSLVGAPEVPVVGDLVVARAWKYDGGAHWVVPGAYEGADHHGHWIYQPAGALVARPGLAFIASWDAMCLIPHEGNWVATFYDEQHSGGLRVYVDISTEVGWRKISRGWEVNSVDMDLDVVRSVVRGIFIDDEDEFEEHSIEFGYPDELIADMREAADHVLGLVREEREPFGSVANAWFERARIRKDTL
ncbi:hypothetical protein BHE16_00710 [Neomicrococcus aestuarii]|uniref:DUF402 domain-containing protein n=1 Tax=Neomicrococcus aestuarii TaxID=556325 RepID=A0A1L2ZQB7_9MICC|nr:hypothetical protein BHE16_00710 [Neomicrococcus aestuarii]